MTLSVASSSPCNVLSMRDIERYTASTPALPISYSNLDVRFSDLQRDLGGLLNDKATGTEMRRKLMVYIDDIQKGLGNVSQQITSLEEARKPETTRMIEIQNQLILNDTDWDHQGMEQTGRRIGELDEKVEEQTNVLGALQEGLTEAYQMLNRLNRKLSRIHSVAKEIYDKILRNQADQKALMENLISIMTQDEF